jgi:hypothetical protein
MYDDSLILLESVGAQTSFSFEKEEEDDVENMQQELYMLLA